mmetsp:Transcript_54204/g.160919  ORF Transcript_54204/g.160919 Transcript_54204/m.160919 type:complete len:247 (+) Transcript_54204:142-882(+)
MPPRRRACMQGQVCVARHEPRPRRRLRVPPAQRRHPAAARRHDEWFGRRRRALCTYHGSRFSLPAVCAAAAAARPQRRARRHRTRGGDREALCARSLWRPQDGPPTALRRDQRARVDRAALAAVGRQARRAVDRPAPDRGVAAARLRDHRGESLQGPAAQAARAQARGGRDAERRQGAACGRRGRRLRPRGAHPQRPAPGDRAAGGAARMAAAARLPDAVARLPHCRPRRGAPPRRRGLHRAAAAL